jgi:plastocyanin
VKTLQLGLIALSTMMLVSCGGGSSTPTTPSPTPTTPAPTPPATSISATVSIPTGASSVGSGAYVPSPVMIAPGGTVRWTNDDTIAHTTTSNSSAWSSGNVGPGGHFDATFPTAGTFPYHCAIHPGMTGTVVVQ